MLFLYAEEGLGNFRLSKQYFGDQIQYQSQKRNPFATLESKILLAFYVND